MAVESPHLQWLSEETIGALSRALGDDDRTRSARRHAFDRFRDLPMEPNPLYRKYGYFAGVDLTGLDPVAVGPAVPVPAAPTGAIQIVHDVSGTRIGLPEELRSVGVTAHSLSETAASDGGSARPWVEGIGEPDDRLAALGAALVNRAVVLEVPPDVPTAVRVQEFTVLSAPHQAMSVRRVIGVGRGSRLLFSEEVFSAPGAAHQRLHGSSTHLELAEDARAAFLSVHAPDEQAVSVYQRTASLGTRAKLVWVWSGFGGFRTKARNRTTLPGQGSEVEDLQTFYGQGDQAYDSDVTVTHLGTDTRGQSITRGVFRDQSRGMSRGLVRIERDARKTVSFLSEHAMLLSRGARSDTIPILEILCRDVKATHSSSVAPVDPERIFYLQSRGIEAQTATRMIAEGFLTHVLERAPVARLTEALLPLLTARWEGRPVHWTEGAFPAVISPELSGGESAAEWRFDSKLR